MSPPLASSSRGQSTVLDTLPLARFKNFPSTAYILLITKESNFLKHYKLQHHLDCLGEGGFS